MVTIQILTWPNRTCVGHFLDFKSCSHFLLIIVMLFFILFGSCSNHFLIIVILKKNYNNMIMIIVIFPGGSEKEPFVNNYSLFASVHVVAS